MTAEVDATAPAPAPAHGGVSMRRLRAWAPWAIGIGFIIVAWLAALVTPGEEEAQAPFVVPAAVGEQATGRNLAATITDVRRAVSVAAGGWSAEGNWLVVDLEAAAVVTERGASITHAVVEVDGVRYSASERPDSLDRSPLAAGIPLAGSLAFELPEGLEAGTGVLELALDTETRLDSMVVLPLDLADIPVVDQADLIETGWANP